MSMRILDTHHHLWDLSKNYYPWLVDHIEPKPYGDYAAIRKNYLVTDFLEDVGDLPVIRSVHLNAGMDPLQESAWVQSVHDDVDTSKGFPHALVATATFFGATPEADLEHHCRFPLMRGVRQITSGSVTAGHPDVLAHPALAVGVGLLAKHGLSFDIQLHPVQMEAVAELAANSPDTPFIVDHAGLVNYGDPALVEVWRKGVRLLAAQPNVRMKMSAFMMFDLQWNAEKIRPYILELIDVFGIDRCFFGSNFPVDRLGGSYRTLWDNFMSATRSFSDDERDKLFYRNAAA